MWLRVGGGGCMVYGVSSTLLKEEVMHVMILIFESATAARSTAI